MVTFSYVLIDEDCDTPSLLLLGQHTSSASGSSVRISFCINVTQRLCGCLSAASSGEGCDGGECHTSEGGAAEIKAEGHS